MLLFDILDNILNKDEYKLFPDNMLDIDVKGISSDSRKVLKGYVFASINGTKADGAQFIPDAISHGATVILTQDLNDAIYCDRTYVVVVKDVRLVLGKMAVRLYFNSTLPLDVIGVTGTNGKTTVSHYVSSILNRCCIPSAVLGTLGGSANGIKIPSDRTTPDAISLCEYISDFARHGSRVLSMEVSSHALELNRVCGIRFNVSIFTNLSEDHLDFHCDMESYGAAKAKLFEQSDVAIINIDDEYGKRLSQSVKCRRVTYSLSDDNADYFASNITHSPMGSEFILNAKENQYEVRISTPGDFSVMNALAAISACCEYGANLNDVINAMASIGQVEGRFERLCTFDGINVILDYAHTPDGIKNVLSTAKGFTKGKLICIVGCGGNREKAKRPVMGDIASQIADYVIITSDNPRSENELSVANDAASALEYKRVNYNIIIDREKAICHALSSASKDDTVIITGKGHEKYQEISGIRYPFSDKDAVLRYISNINKSN